jgi:tetratricopeptide (TPR) repeat protein
LARSGRTREACRRIEQVLLGPNRTANAAPAALAFAEVARCAEGAGEIAIAEHALQRATELRPRFADLQHRYACVLVAQGRRLEARRALERALETNPRYVAARVELALLDAQDGLVGEAVRTLQALVEEAPLQDRRAFQQGVARLERADWEGADGLLRRALERPDAELESEIARYHELMREGQCEQALAVVEAMVERHDAYPDLHFLVGTAEIRLGMMDDALVSLARALELHPDFLDARVAFAQALEAVGRIAEGIEQAQWVLDQEPSHVGAQELVATHRRHPRAA